MEREALDPRQVYASVLDRAFAFEDQGVQFKLATSLLRCPPADPEAVELDGQTREIQDLLGAVEQALQALGRVGRLTLQAASQGRRINVAGNRPEAARWDFLADWLSRALGQWPDEALDLSVSTVRLLEECRPLSPGGRRKTPLGRGFEAQHEERLRLRFDLLRSHSDLLGAFDVHQATILETPQWGIQQFELDVGRPLSRRELRWIEMERFVAMLRTARSTIRKLDQGHIRQFLRIEPDTGYVVLDRYGAHGHWLVTGRGDRHELARAGTFAARATDETREPTKDGWRALVVGRLPPQAPNGDASPPARLDEAYILRDLQGASDISLESVHVGLRPAEPTTLDQAIAAAASAPSDQSATGQRQYALRVDGDYLLLASLGGPRGHAPLAQVGLEDREDRVLEFLDVLGRTKEAAGIRDEVDAAYANASAVRWTRALLKRPIGLRTARAAEDLTGLSVRLVYIPTPKPHPLGGLPMIGLQFVADHLERLGVRVDILTIPAHELRRRRIELLGADVVGLSVYVTNRREVARMVKLLREADYAGKIILGGPEVREIDLVQSAIPGWDAIIRGEGEEVLPDVLRVMRLLAAGDAERALALARRLSGVAIAHGELVILADTAAKNTASKIVCPLPFEWERCSEDRILKMNFTRGCPYECGFCPNHQGRKFHSCGAREMWKFTLRAAADALRLPAREERRRAKAIQDEFGITAPPSLRLALNVLLRDDVPVGVLHRLCGMGVPGGACADERVSPWQAKSRWLDHKATLLARAAPYSPGEHRPSSGDRPTLERFELMTSEDNTLVNRRDVLRYMKKRRRRVLRDVVVFNPGQNTIRDLTNRHGALDYEYVEAISRANPFKVVLGTDGTANPVLRQIEKPYYSIGEAVELNRALVQRGVDVHNNYILLTPETDLLESIEALALFVLLPIKWRDHGPNVNLAIVKEAGTRSHDEGLLFDPADKGHGDPLRFPAVRRLLRRWKLTVFVASADLPDLIWRILSEDREARRLLPKVVRRWERDFDEDPLLKGIARHVRAAQRPGVPLVVALREVAAAYERCWPSAPEPVEVSPSPGLPSIAASTRPRSRRQRGRIASAPAQPRASS